MKSIDIKKYPFDTKIDETGITPYYVVRFKDFDNVVGTGETIEEAINDAFEVLEEEVDYRLEKHLAIPDPSISALPEPSGKITLRMPKSLHRKLIVFAEEEGVSLNSAINNILAESIGAEKAVKASSINSAELSGMTLNGVLDCLAVYAQEMPESPRSETVPFKKPLMGTA